MRQWEFQFMRVTPRVGNYIRINPMASLLEWLLYFWVEGDHCCIHVRLNLLCRSIVGYRQSYIFHVHKRIGQKMICIVSIVHTWEEWLAARASMVTVTLWWCNTHLINPCSHCIYIKLKSFGCVFQTNTIQFLFMVNNLG